MEGKTELILIRISGVDRPGLTASISEILSKYDVDIMDIGQADIHSTLSLGILFKCCDRDSGNIMKDLLFKASELGINIRFYPITAQEYEDWVNMQGKNSDIFKRFGLKSGFKNYLVDSEGIIVAKDITADELASYMD